MPETHIAHCGACAGRMVLISAADAHWFVCLACGEETAPRPTAAQAAEDVVWVTVAQSRRQPLPPVSAENPADRSTAGPTTGPTAGPTPKTQRGQR